MTLDPRVQHYRARVDVDPKFLALVAELDAAHYGHWRKGESHPWRGHDMQATLEESKALFDRLHGAIWQAHAVAVAEANAALPEAERYADIATEVARDDQGRTVNRLALAKARLEADPDALATIKAWASEQGLAIDTKAA